MRTWAASRVVRDLMAAGLFVIGKLQAVERGGRGQRDAPMLRQHPLLSQWIDLAAGRRQERVQSQALVIVDVLIAQSRAKDALAQQFLHRMIDPSGGALIVKADRKSTRLNSSHLGISYA